MKSIKNNDKNGLNLVCCVVILIALCFPSCKKFVEVSPPATLLTSPTVFADNTTATSAQLAIYIQMNSKPTNGASTVIAKNCGLLSDEFKVLGTELISNQLYTNNLTAITAAGQFGEWTNPYNYISQENAILENLPSSSGVSASVKQQLTGEALFVRAFWLFYLTNMYGDVPMPLTTNYQVNDQAARVAKSQVYQQVISDLLLASSLLNTQYVDGTSIATTGEKVRPTSWAAKALLARVYLYNKQYAQAEAIATDVIANGGYTLCPDPNSVFLKNSSEAIWQLMIPTPPTNGYNTGDGNFFVLRSAPLASSTNVGLSSQLLAAFEPNDSRYTKWVSTFSVGSPVVTYSFPYKYKNYNGSTSIVNEYVMVLRLAELYLIRAEARAQQGSNLTGAANDLNMIRTRAGLGNTSASTQSSLLNAILHERQIELFSEWGHRWLDLIRTGNIDAVMGSPGFIAQAKGGNWASYKQLLPIPQSEIVLDPNLTQNTGY